MASTNDTSTTQTDELTQPPAEGDATAAPEKAPRKTAKKATRKRATSKAGAAAPAAAPEAASAAAPEAASLPAAAEEATATPETDSAGTDLPAAAPAKKAARKRASRKTAAPSAAAAQTSAEPSTPADEPAPPVPARDDSSLPADAAGDTESESAPAPRRRRGRASAKVATPAPAEPAVSNLRVDDTSVGDAQATELDPESDDTESDTESGGTGSDQPGSFGVLFQAPAPTRSRRRATSPSAQPTVPDASAPDDAAAPSPQDAPSDDEAPSTREDSPSDDDDSGDGPRRRRRRGGKGRRGRGGDTDSAEETETADQPPARRGRRGAAAASTEDTDDAADAAEGSGRSRDDEADDAEGSGGGSRRRTRRRRRSGSSGDGDDAPGVVTRVREPRRERDRDEVTSLKGSTRLEAKKQRRREGREAGRRRTIITEAEFLSRRESVERVMVVRNKDDRTQIAVLEDDVLVEHYISRETNVSMAGNIYLGRVQNVLPSMEAAFVDIGKGRNAVLYAGEVNWDAAGMEANQPKRIENALSSGESVLVQVTKDPIGHKGARLTSQISLPGRYLVYVPNSSMTGISRKLPDTERTRLKKILKEVVPDSAGVIVRTAAEGASEAELRADVERLTATWDDISAKADRAGKGKGKGSGSAPMLLHGEPDLTVRVIRDVFNEDFASLVVAGQQAWDEVSDYVSSVAPDLAERVTRWTSEEDLFTHFRIDEQIAKAMDRKVWLPSGGSLVIDRTEAMTVVDVNTGKFIGAGGNLEETVTKNNIEAAEEIVRQLRLRDIGGIIVVDFIDMVLEANRDLVVRRLLECLGRDRTKHQVAEVTSLGLVQMTRKRVGSGLIEVFGETCEHCNGRGIIVHADPVDRGNGEQSGGSGGSSGSQQSGGSAASGRGGTRGRRGKATTAEQPAVTSRPAGPTPAQIAAAAHAAALKSGEPATVAALVIDEAQEQAETEQDEAEQDGPVTQEEAVVLQDAQPRTQDLSQDQSQNQSQDRADAGSDRTEPAAQPEKQPDAEPVAAPRSRRRRGRVVAPAGPPGGGAAPHTEE